MEKPPGSWAGEGEEPGAEAPPEAAEKAEQVGVTAPSSSPFGGIWAADLGRSLPEQGLLS